MLAATFCEYGAMHGPALFAPLGVALRGHANRISMSIAILREA
jgi:hypothetical protein